jgi:hypothetical protein
MNISSPLRFRTEDKNTKMASMYFVTLQVTDFATPMGLNTLKHEVNLNKLIFKKFGPFLKENTTLVRYKHRLVYDVQENDLCSF